jgi:hypothetical protein
MRLLPLAALLATLACAGCGDDDLELCKGCAQPTVTPTLTATPTPSATPSPEPVP